MEPNNEKFKLSENFFSNLMLVVIGVLCYMGISHFDTVWGVLKGGWAILAPFVWGAVIAYLLDFIVRALDRGPLKERRALRVLLAYVIAFFCIGALLMLLVPQLVSSVKMLVTSIPDYFNSMDAYISALQTHMADSAQLEKLLGSYEQALKTITEAVSGVFPRVINYGMALGSGLVSSITALMFSVYMLLDKEKLLKQMKKLAFTFLPERHARRVLRVLARTNQTFGGFIGGKILDSLIIGVLCFIICAVLRIPYALLISVVVGCTNVIPVFGPFLGAIPCAFILLIVNPFSALEFLIMILILQQFDGNVLGPKILGESTGLSALWVLFAIIVGGKMLGFVGMLIGVPTFAVVYSLVAEYTDIRLGRKGIDAQGNPVPHTEPVQEDDSDMKLAP